MYFDILEMFIITLRNVRKNINEFIVFYVYISVFDMIIISLGIHHKLYEHVVNEWSVRY